MGVCLSCLRPNIDDDELTENTPLLQDTLSDDDKLASLRKRQEELDKIVNETNEQLIDVTTFFSTHTTNSNATTSVQSGLVRRPLNGQLQDKDQLNELQLKASEHFSDFTDDELQQLTEFNDQVLKQIESEVKITKRGPLLVEF